MDAKLKSHLDKLGIKYKIHKHKATFTVAESRDVKKNIPGRQTKCLFMKDENSQFYLIAIPAEKMLDKKEFRKKLGIKHLLFASPEELKAELNLTPGNVSIFGLINSRNVFLIMDKALWDSPIVCFHPNINTETLEIPHESLEIFYNSLKSKKEIIEL